MLKLTRTHRTWVSNRMAVFAAFLLIAATVAGIGGSFNEHQEAGATLVDTESVEGGAGQGGQVSALRTGKGFKVNLYLFRRN